MAKQTFTTGQVLTAAQMTSLQQTAMGGGAATAKTASYVLTAADAGTVVQMNAAGATTITVNTALFAAGDSVQIQNIGAGVCTVTAGTATVTTAGSLALSQWEGGNLYFTSTSASIFFDIVQTSGMTNPMTTTGDTIYSSSGSTPARLGIGSANQVLRVNSGATAPEWATIASGAYTLLSTTTLSGSNQVISSIDQTYKHLFVLITGMTNSTGDGALRMDCNSNASSAFYSRTGQVGYTASTGAAGGDQFSPMVNTVDRTSAVNAVAVMYFDYATAGVHPYSFQSGYVATGGALESVNGGGAIRFGTAAAISSIRFHNYGGGFTAGTVKIYGVN